MSLYSTGREFEKTIFGKCLWEKDWLIYTPKRECVQEIIKKGESETPTILFIKKFVQKRLKRKVKVYSSLKSPLDLWHGIDGFFICGKHIITIDATLNREKTKKKTDLFIRQSDMEDPYKIINKITDIFSFKIKLGISKRRSKKRLSKKV